MNDFKVGDEVWTKNFHGYENYFPDFCKYTIVAIADKNSEMEWYCLKTESRDSIIECYARFCYKSKNEAIETMIKQLEKQKVD